MRILMLGNSLTTANDLPTLLGTAVGAEVVVHARGGARLAEHLNPETRLGSMTSRALQEEPWDFVILQESSNGPVVHRERFLEAASRLCARISETGATPVFYATWAYAPTCPKLAKMGISRDAMHELLASAYDEAAHISDALVAHVGSAFFEHEHVEELYRADGVHPTVEGTGLSVRVIAETLRSKGASGSAVDFTNAVSAAPSGTFTKPAVASSPGDSAATIPAASSGASECMAAAGVQDQANGSNSESAYTVYILRCEDGSLYTGITTDIERRLQEHLSRGAKAARYTRTHPVVAVEATFDAPDRATASALEYRIKRLSHAEKLALIESARPES